MTVTVRCKVHRVSLRESHASITLAPEMPPTGDLRLPPMRYTMSPADAPLRAGITPGVYLNVDISVDPNQAPNPNAEGAWQQYAEQVQAQQQEALRAAMGNVPQAPEAQFPGVAGADAESTGDRSPAPDDRSPEQRG